MDDTPVREPTHPVTIPSRRGVFAAAGASALAALTALLRPEAATGARRKKKKKGSGKGASGPPGPQGPAGLQGPAGSQGPAGPAGPVQIAYAHVNPDGTFHHARGVVDIETVDRQDGSLHRTYCFQLEFAPNVAVGSPFLNNNAVVAIALGYDNDTGTCPEGYQDAKVRVYAANSPTSEVRNDVHFKIVFY